MSLLIGLCEYGETRRNETGKIEELGEEPAPVSTCTPQIPHGLTRAPL
jgi:hypothetical protein